MTPNNSDVWTMPAWISMASSKTGPLPILIPPKSSTRPRSRSWQDGEVRIGPSGRPVTLKALPTPQRQQEHMGLVRRGQPPPDLMRVASSVALLGALFVALVLQWVVGG